VRVDFDGRVRVTIPRGGSRRAAEVFAREHLEWIERQRTRLTESRYDPRERHLLRLRAKHELPARLVQLAAEHRINASRVSIRDQRSRWGSCGRDGHISLNWRLILMPGWVRDYVLIHELMHLKRLDHSAQFWRLVAAAFPNYQAARRWLRLHGPTLR
jgi:predicted metal-dependent hydrolase